MKKTFLCLLALLFALSITAFAETTEIVQKELLPETTTTALSVNDFVTDTEYPYETIGYFLNDVVFLGEDTMEVSITFTGNYGSNEYFFSKCYIPVYNYETGKLLDIFYSDVELKRPFATSSRTTIKRMISTKNIDTDIYKIKVIMLESLTSLRPNCPVPYLANELVISKNDIAKKVPTATITTVLNNVPLSKDVSSVGINFSYNQFKLSETAKALGYTPDMILGYNGTTNYYLQCKYDNVDLKPYVGLTCDFEVDLSDIAYPRIISVTPTDGRNAEIVVNPDLLMETDLSDGYIEYKTDIDDERCIKIKVPYQYNGVLNVYKNLVPGSWGSDVVPGGNVGDVTYRFVDTNGDAIYDTVFIDNVGVFVVGSINEKAHIIYRDTTSPNAMHNFTYSSSLTLDPEDEFVNWSLKDKNGNTIELSDIEVGSVAQVAISTDGSCEFYDIVISNDTIEGVVSEVYAEFAEIYYRIGDGVYTMLSYFSTLVPGDAVTATVWGTKIVNYTVDTGVRYGVVVGTKMIAEFDTTTYQLQILNQDGEIIPLNMAQKVNGNTYVGSDFDYTSSQNSKDAIIAYKLNSKGQIVSYDLEQSGSFYTWNLIQSEKLIFNNEGYYKESSQKLDSYYLTDDTVIIATNNAKGSNDKNDYALVTADILDETKTYHYTLIYNENKEIEFVVLYCANDGTQQPDDEIQDEIHYGVIIATNIVSDFSTTYQLQILNQDGEVEVLNLADKVNGATPSYATTSTLNVAFPKGTWMAYRLNSEGNIGLYDHSNYPGTRNVLSTEDRFVTVRGNCSNSNIANYQIVTESKLTGTEVAASDVAYISTSNCGKIDAESFDSDKTYEADMIINNNQEILFAFVHETTPITDESDDMNPVGDIQYGIVVATNVATDYGTTYQLQILKQDGQVDVLQMAEKVNGTSYYGADFDYTSAQSSNDTIIAYQLNSSGEIVAYDVGDDSFTTNFFETDHRLAFGDNGNYHKATQRLDSYYITDDTVIITTKCAKGANSKDDYEISSIDIFDETEVYTYTVVYNENKEAKFVVLYQTFGYINMNTDPFVVMKRSTVYLEGENRFKYHGYINGEEVELIEAESRLGYPLLNVNDIAMISTNAAGEIVGVTKLAAYGVSGYTVIDNTPNAKDDEKIVQIGTSYEIKFVPTYNTASLNTFFTAGSTNTLKGFGAVGKAYDIKGNTLQLIAPANYACSYVSGMGGYRDYGVNDCYISDYTINSDTVAYIYNCMTGKIKVRSIFDLETETNTNDFRVATQLENDDAVYVYNYDGDTKLILIVDTKGDNSL